MATTSSLSFVAYSTFTIKTLARLNPIRVHHSSCKSSFSNYASTSHRVIVSSTQSHASNDNIPATNITDSLNTSSQPNGQVFLVGTGPGDPNMLTLGAINAMKMADVVLYDRLVSDEILSYINPKAQKILVGKGRGIGTGSQSTIDQALSNHAKQGKRVVRLKGGDPAVFGRVGTEIDHLNNQHIPVITIPGITSASGIAASLGFPLTHGGIADGVVLLTAHTGVSWFDATNLQRLTLVLYMGLQELPSIMQKLIETGADPSTATVAVQSGTTPEQRAVWGNINNISERVYQAQLQSPTLIIVGNVVRFASDWQLANEKLDE